MELDSAGRVGRGVREEAENKEGLRDFTSTFTEHIDQRALGVKTRVTYINMKEDERKKSEEKVHTWELEGCQ